MKHPHTQQPSGFFKPFTVAAFSLVLGVTMALSMAGCTNPMPTENYPQESKFDRLPTPPADDDFAFPTKEPKLSVGKKVFEEKCPNYPAALTTYSVVHHVKPIDMYLDIAHGKNSCSKDMTRDDRWAAVFYIRYLSGEYDIKTPAIDAVFGGNCAVCHGGKGMGDGSLYTGHASAHELGMAPVKMAFSPPPANFHDAPRLYNRSNAILVKFINEGIYPSAMPSWKGRVDSDKNIVFDDAVILDLVKYVRSLSVINDLNINQGDNGGQAASESGSNGD